jgi:hypothetical protein
MILIILSNLLLLSKAAAETTKNEPPNMVEFDGVRDGRLTTSKLCGRRGPGPAIATPPPAPAPDPTSLLLATILPLITSLPQKSEPLRDSMNTQPFGPTTPTRRRTTPPAEIFSPAAAKMEELHFMLLDLNAKTSIDLLAKEKVLADIDITPDIIAHIPTPRLSELTGLTEGKTTKLKSFATEWWIRLERKHGNGMLVD